MRRRRGLFITLEGVEGSGKTTQVKRLADVLRRRGHDVVETREPGGTVVAEAIRQLLLHETTEPVVPTTEALLICAARSQHVARVIEPALQRGAVVLCDRFFDSTMAYQGYARGIPLSPLRTMNRLATQGLSPDLTLLFDVPVSTGLARRRHIPVDENRLDRETKSFHERVRRGFLALQRANPQRMKRIDASQSPDLVSHRVKLVVTQFLEQPRMRARLARGH